MATKPVKTGYISSSYEAHQQRSPIGSWGIDIGTKQTDPIEIVAAYSGKVYLAGWSDTFGNRIWINNTDGEAKGFYTVYPHMIKLNPNLKTGSIVKEGDWLGDMGNTGTISQNGKLVTNKADAKGVFPIAMPAGRHLHFENRTTPDTTGKSIKPSEIIKLYQS